MSSLADLERTIVRKRKNLERRSSGVSTKRESLERPTAHSLGRRRTRTLSTKINYSVPDAENIDVIAQPSGKTCWATVFTMMYGWKTQTCLTIETALSEIGPKWVKLFKDDKGLLPNDKKVFVATTGLVAEPPMNPSVIGWEKLLRDYGPIWVTTDEAPGKPWAIHARIIVAVRGDGTPAGTKFKIIDPAGGREYTETIKTFVPKYEEEVRKTGYTRIQILHWPKDARYGATKAMAAYRQLPARALTGEQCFDIRYNVDLVPQQTGMSCWAAGAAMIVGWRDRICIDPSEIPKAVGYWKQYKEGLHPEDTKMFQVWGLTPEPPQTYTVEGFRQLLEDYGPLWVASKEGGPHIRVVTGISGDGSSPDGTTLYINDPWEQGMKQFKPSNKGSRYTETYRQFVQKQSELAVEEMHFPYALYVAHLPQLPSWYGGTNATAGTITAKSLSNLGIDLSDFETPYVREFQAATDWCQIRHSIIRSAVEIQGDWLTAGGNLMKEGNPKVRDMLIMFWRDGVGMTQQQAQATAAISAADHPTQGFWSAAFISWCVRNAMGSSPPPHNGGFLFHMRHMAYIAQAMRNRENNDQTRPFWLYDINDPKIVPEDGDILCLNRSGTSHTYQSIRQQWFVNNPNQVATGSSHCDIVVGHDKDAGRQWIETIGGNVDDTVGSRYYSLDANGRLVDQVQLNGTPVANRGNVTQAVGNRPLIVFGLIRLTACPNFPS